MRGIKSHWVVVACFYFRCKVGRVRENVIPQKTSFPNKDRKWFGASKQNPRAWTYLPLFRLFITKGEAERRGVFRPKGLFAFSLLLSLLGLHYSKPKGEPASEERYN